MTNSNGLSDRELLIRIDERQKGLSDKMDDVCDTLEKKVDDDKDYNTLKTKVNTLWDNQNKAIGWIIAGATGGGLAQLAGLLVTNIFAAF